MMDATHSSKQPTSESEVVVAFSGREQTREEVTDTLSGRDVVDKPVGIVGLGIRDREGAC